MKTLRLLLACGLVGVLTGCPGTTTATDDAGRDARALVDSPTSEIDAPVEGVDAPVEGVDAPVEGVDASVEVTDAPGSDAPGTSDAPSARTDAHAPPTSDAGMCMDLPPDPTRPTGVVCSPCRPPGAMSSGGRGECMSDADCTEGANGRCGFGRIGSFCSYDTCFSDADCDVGEACLCDGSNLGGGGNACVHAGCRTNNDCDPGYACSPTFGGCGHYSGFIAFECHTAADECTVDADCGGFGYCAFDSAVSHWVCSTTECAG